MAFGSPVVPEVNPSKATSSLPVLIELNCTGFSKANLSRLLLWFAVPSKGIRNFKIRNEGLDLEISYRIFVVFPSCFLFVPLFFFDFAGLGLDFPGQT